MQIFTLLINYYLMENKSKELLQLIFQSASTANSSPAQAKQQIEGTLKQWVELNAHHRTWAHRDGIIKTKKNIEAVMNDKIEEGLLSAISGKNIKNMLFGQIDNTSARERNRSENNHRRVARIGRKLQIYSSDESLDELEVKAADQSSLIDETNDIETRINQRKHRNKKKYLTFDPEFKEEVCKVATDQGIEFAMEKYNLSARKINNWIEALSNNILGKGRKALDPAMEFNMCVWLLKKIWNRVPLTQKVIRQKAAGVPSSTKKSFNGSKGWLQKFFLRHVQVKSCFDFRNKDETREECARYHQCAFARLCKDYDNFMRLPEHAKNIVKGDLQKIIYRDGSHPLLKLWQDKKLDAQRMSQDNLFNFQDLQKFTNIKFEQKKYEDEYQDYDEGDDEFEEEDGKLLKLQKSQQISQSLIQPVYEDEESSEKVKKQEESDSEHGHQMEIYQESETQSLKKVEQDEQ